MKKYLLALLFVVGCGVAPVEPTRPVVPTDESTSAVKLPPCIHYNFMSERIQVPGRATITWTPPGAAGGPYDAASTDTLENVGIWQGQWSYDFYRFENTSNFCDFLTFARMQERQFTPGNLSKPVDSPYVAGGCQNYLLQVLPLNCRYPNGSVQTFPPGTFKIYGSTNPFAARYVEWAQYTWNFPPPAYTMTLTGEFGN